MSVHCDLVTAGDPEHIAGALADHFVELHGRRPDGVWMAPGRVNLIGEHTDYNDGLCLPIAVPHATYAAVARRDDGRITAASDLTTTVFTTEIDQLSTERPTGWAAYVAGVAWAAREDGIDVSGFDVVFTSTVPVGSGLSSSAALECSLALALAELAGTRIDDELRRRLVEVCGRAEREVVGAPTGGMDQTISLLATAGHALLLDFERTTSVPVAWSPDEHGVALLVIDTRVSHALDDGGYGSRRADCERAAIALDAPTLRQADPAAVGSLPDALLRRRARHVVTEIGRVEEAVAAIDARDWSALGRLFDASHTSLRDDFEVSCDELDQACETARQHGALGARMTGGGFGGSAIALLPVDLVDEVRVAVAHRFADRGWSAPGFLDAPASGGARRLIDHG